MVWIGVFGEDGILPFLLGFRWQALGDHHPMGRITEIHPAVTFGDFALVAPFAASGENPHVFGDMLKRVSSE